MKNLYNHLLDQVAQKVERLEWKLNATKKQIREYRGERHEIIRDRIAHDTYDSTTHPARKNNEIWLFDTRPGDGAPGRDMSREHTRGELSPEQNSSLGIYGISVDVDGTDDLVRAFVSTAHVALMMSHLLWRGPVAQLRQGMIKVSPTLTIPYRYDVHAVLTMPHEIHERALLGRSATCPALREWVTCRVNVHHIETRWWKG